MEEDLYISILGSLSPEVIQQLYQTEIQAECIFTKQPDCQDDQEFVNSFEGYKLQVRGKYIVQCAPNSTKIVGGIYLSLEIQFQIIRLQSAIEFEIEKAFAIALYLPDKYLMDQPIIIKLGVEVTQSEKINKFGASLANKEITHLQMYSDFKIEQRLFKTDSACVYAATRNRDNKKVAIKCINKIKYKETNRSIEKGIQRQFLLPFRLKHKSICEFYQLYDSEATVGVVMELLDINLLQFLKKRGFKSANQFRKTLKDIFEAISFLHQNNIMHRDLKLENIMMKIVQNKEDTYQPIIIDFGLAEYEGVKPYLFNKCGTPGYTAPEILADTGNQGNYTKACDLFSLGCIFYNFLFQKPLFIAGSLQDIIKLNRDFVLDDNDPRFTYVHESAKELLFGLIRQDPTKRFTIKEALNQEFFVQQIKQEESAQVCKSNKSETDN